MPSPESTLLRNNPPSPIEAVTEETERRIEEEEREQPETAQQEAESAAQRELVLLKKQQVLESILQQGMHAPDMEGLVRTAGFQNLKDAETRLDINFLKLDPAQDNPIIQAKEVSAWQGWARRFAAERTKDLVSKFSLATLLTYAAFSIAAAPVSVPVILGGFVGSQGAKTLAGLYTRQWRIYKKKHRGEYSAAQIMAEQLLIAAREAYSQADQYRNELKALEEQYAEGEARNSQKLKLIERQYAALSRALLNDARFTSGEAAEFWRLEKKALQTDKIAGLAGAVVGGYAGHALDARQLQEAFQTNLTEQVRDQGVYMQGGQVIDIDALRESGLDDVKISAQLAQGHLVKEVAAGTTDALGNVAAETQYGFAVTADDLEEAKRIGGEHFEQIYHSIFHDQATGQPAEITQEYFDQIREQGGQVLHSFGDASPEKGIDSYIDSKVGEYASQIRTDGALRVGAWAAALTTMEFIKPVSRVYDRAVEWGRNKLQGKADPIFELPPAYPTEGPRLVQEAPAAPEPRTATSATEAPLPTEVPSARPGIVQRFRRSWSRITGRPVVEDVPSPEPAPHSLSPHRPEFSRGSAPEPIHRPLSGIETQTATVREPSPALEVQPEPIPASEAQPEPSLTPELQPEPSPAAPTTTTVETQPETPVEEKPADPSTPPAPAETAVMESAPVAAESPESPVEAFEKSHPEVSAEVFTSLKQSFRRFVENSEYGSQPRHLLYFPAGKESNIADQVNEIIQKERGNIPVISIVYAAPTEQISNTERQQVMRKAIQQKLQPHLDARSCVIDFLQFLPRGVDWDQYLRHLRESLAPNHQPNYTGVPIKDGLVGEEEGVTAKTPAAGKQRKKRKRASAGDNR
jgi:hypothetical protein